MKQTISLLLFASCILLMSGCRGRHSSGSTDEDVAEVICPCPPTIILQPCNNFTEEEAKALLPHLKQLVKECTASDYEFEVAPVIKLSDSLKNNNRSRYRADKMINSIPNPSFNGIIMLTHQDVSVSYKGKADWGVLGLALRPKHVCVASDFRLKNKKRDFWKVAAHELFHSFFNLPHCSKDDPHCIMRDAKGHADFANKEHLCKDCAGKI